MSLKIHNDFRALEQFTNEILIQVRSIDSLKNDLKSQIDDLYNAGFRDAKFTELKNVINNFNNDLKDFEKNISESLSHLNERSQMLHQYYNVRI